MKDINYRLTILRGLICILAPQGFDLKPGFITRLICEYLDPYQSDFTYKKPYLTGYGRKMREIILVMRSR
jgi:hypothetical protein